MPIIKRQAADVQNAAMAQAQGRSIGGITPEGVIEITENGLFDVAEYAQANVNVSGGYGDYGGIEFLSTGFSQVKLHIKQIKYAVVPSGWNCTKIDISECESMDYQGFRSLSKVVDLGNGNVLTKLTTLVGSGSYFQSCSALKKIHLPNLVEFVSLQNMFKDCASLEDVLLGSVGHPISSRYFSDSIFSNDTQANLTITVYTTSEHVEALITAIRNGATNATIIIKDSTTGETLVTSTPT